VTEGPGPGQSPRGNNGPVDQEEPASSAGSPSEHGATSSLHDIDAALTTLRVGDRPSDDAGNPWLERLDLRSPDPRVCPFLRALDDTDQLAVPIGAPDALNRCAALREAIPQSLRQQELVCLTSGHVNCPRYLRGAMAAEATPRRAALTLSAVRRPAIPRPSLSPAILAATLVLIAAFAGSVAFVVARGGLALPVAAVERPSPSPSTLAVAPTPEPSPSPTPTPTPEPTPTPTPEPTPTPTPAPSPTPTPTPEPTPTPTPKPPGDPILARFPELRRCPSRSNCYIYIVEPGNNLFSIARYYRVSYDRVLQMSPWITNPANIRAGDEVRMPTPQRPSR
jgi:hypothetical protein